MRNKIIKGITLALFSSLIIAFVGYRSGYFEGKKSNYSISPNGSALNNQIDTIPKIDSIPKTDTVPKIDSIKKLEMLSSSKVVILIDHFIKQKDSLQTSADSVLKINPIIHSTKAGIILKPIDFTGINLDSSILNKSDSLKE